MSGVRPGRAPLALAAVFGLFVAVIALVRPTAPLPLRVGSPAPAFDLPELRVTSGSPRSSRSLEDLRGRVVFVNFWATWCPPCRDEAPSLERLYRRYAPSGLEVLAVSIDEPAALEAVQTFVKELDLTVPVLLDPERDTYRRYQATGVPETFVVGPDGRVVERLVGPREWDDPRYAALVERLLGVAPPSPGADAPPGLGG